MEGITVSRACLAHPDGIRRSAAHLSATGEQGGHGVAFMDIRAAWYQQPQNPLAGTVLVTLALGEAATTQHELCQPNFE